IEKQADQVLDLLFGQRARIAHPRHLRAGVIGLGVIDLAVGVFLRVGAVAAGLAEAAQARTDRSVGKLLGRELMAVVAAAARGIAGLVGPLLAAPVLRDRLASLPVSDEAALGEGDGLHLLG